MFENKPGFGINPGSKENDKKESPTSYLTNPDWEGTIRRRRKVQKEDGMGIWENIEETENQSAPPLTAETLEEAQKKHVKFHHLNNIEMPLYEPDPLDWDFYDKSLEKEPISMLFYARQYGGGNINQERLDFLNDKEKQWDAEEINSKNVIDYFKNNNASEEKELFWKKEFR